MNKIITFGEILLRLKSPGFERLFQTPNLEATFGGAEANVAVSLAQFGMNAAFVTVLPKNEIANASIMELNKYGVDTSSIQFGEGRVGIYFLETGANQRPSKVVYDRSGSSIALATSEKLDWNEIFKNAEWFHISGITPALSKSAANLSIQAVKIAKEKGLTVSCDLNFRAKLWKYGISAQEIMGEIIKYTDICIANEEDIQKALGINFDKIDGPEKDFSARYQILSEELLKRFTNIQVTAITLRESKTANYNDWSACMHDTENFFISRRYSVYDIVDRIGSGDSFVAGLIYGLNHYDNKQDALEFATAASCFKHSIIGDFNRVSISEVQAIMSGNVSGRVQR